MIPDNSNSPSGHHSPPALLPRPASVAAAPPPTTVEATTMAEPADRATKGKHKQASSTSEAKYKRIRSSRACEWIWSHLPSQHHLGSDGRIDTGLECKKRKVKCSGNVRSMRGTQFPGTMAFFASQLLWYYAETLVRHPAAPVRPLRRVRRGVRLGRQRASHGSLVGDQQRRRGQQRRQDQRQRHDGRARPSPALGGLHRIHGSHATSLGQDAVVVGCRNLRRSRTVHLRHTRAAAEPHADWQQRSGSSSSNGQQR